MTTPLTDLQRSGFAAAAGLANVAAAIVTPAATTTTRANHDFNIAAPLSPAHKTPRTMAAVFTRVRERSRKNKRLARAQIRQTPPLLLDSFDDR
jgi:hypothetical protein